MTLTTCPVYTAEEWADKLLQLFPKRWSSVEARKTGMVLHSVFAGIGSQFGNLQEELLYAFKASRIGTAEDEALDRVCADFFGPTFYFPATLSRTKGEPDSSFRQRIFAAMFLGGGTRATISKIIERLTSSVPRIVEPWNVSDCAALDAQSYVDIDTVANSGRVSDCGLRGAMFVESVLPSFGDQGVNPVYGLDAGLAVDYGFIIDPKPSWFQGQAQMDLLVNTKKLLGTKVFRKWTVKAMVTYPIGNSVSIPPGAGSVVIDVYPPFSGPYTVLAQASWNTNISYRVLSHSSFELIFSTPADALASIDWLAAPLTVSGYGSLPIQGGEVDFSIAIPENLQNWKVIPMATWNGTLFAKTMAADLAEFGFSGPPSDLSAVSYATFPPSRSGVIAVNAGSLSATVVLPVDISVAYQAFVVPTWNTNCKLSGKAPNHFDIDFNVAPDVDCQLYWGVYVRGQE